MNLSWVAALLGVISIPGAELKWLNPVNGPFFWREISVVGDKIYLPTAGVIAASTNGRDWQLHYADQSFNFLSVAGSTDRLILTAQGSTSFDSVLDAPAIFTWSEAAVFSQASTFERTFKQVEFGNGVFVATTTGTQDIGTYYSADGVNWERASGVADGDYQFSDLFFGGGKFLRLTPRGVYLSENGESWRRVSEFRGERAAFHAGLFAIAGPDGVSLSTNGMDWETRTVEVPDPVRAIAIGPAGIVIAGESLGRTNNEALFSEDTTNWVRFDLPFQNRVRDIRYLRAEFLMVGDGLIAHSSDGTNWTQQASGVDLGIRAVVKGESRLLAVGSSRHGEDRSAMISSDGMHWEPVLLGEGAELTSAAYRDGTFVVAGLEGYIAVSDAEGEKWNKAQSAVTRDLFSVTAYEDGFVAVGRGTVIRSADGKVWEAMPETRFVFYDVAYGNGVFIAIAGGHEGALISRDLLTWEFLPPPFKNSSQVEFGNGRFVLGPAAAVSTDGINWTTGSENDLQSIYFSEEMFMGLGYTGTTESRTVKISRDGLRWHSLARIPAPLTPALGRYFGRFLGFDEHASVLELDGFVIMDANAAADGSLRVTLHRPAAQDAELESSVDLLSWIDVTGDIENFPTSAPRMFFRAKAK